MRNPIFSIALAVTTLGGINTLLATCAFHAPIAANRPVLPKGVHTFDATFIDPSARVIQSDNIRILCKSFIGPFVTLNAVEGSIRIGEETNLQDNVNLVARAGGDIVFGDRVIAAHGATVYWPSRIGAPLGLPAFLGFNAYVDGASAEPDTMVLHLARVAPGIVIRSGIKVLPGKFIQTQQEADDTGLGKVALVTQADRDFMAGVLHVNENLAAHYAELYLAEGMDAVRGIGKDPGYSDFNPIADIPRIGGSNLSLPSFQNRIIGNVTMADELSKLQQVMSESVSIRADEGDPFTVGTIEEMKGAVTFHALEHHGIVSGDGGKYGYHMVVHGGPLPFDPDAHYMKIGKKVTMGDWSVVFRSSVGDGSVIGFKALVDGCQLAPGTVIPDRAIVVNNVTVGTVEW